MAPNIMKQGTGALKHSSSRNGDINMDIDKNLEQLKNYVYVCIISADNDEFGLTEDEKQTIIERHSMNMDWEYTLEPIKDETVRKGLVEFFNKES